MNLFTFLSLLLGFSFFSLFINNGVVFVDALHKIYPELQSLQTDAAVIKPLHRTRFHFQPRRHWINGSPNVLQGNLSLVLSVQSQRRSLGKHRLGSLNFQRFNQLEAIEARSLPFKALRHQWLLVRLRHRPPRQQARHLIHRNRPPKPSGPKLRRSGQSLRPISNRVDQTGSQPDRRPGSGSQRQRLPGPDDSVAERRRPLEDHNRQQKAAKGSGVFV
ncbi:unnamed protein product [Citrullus colocynthis]|uniref:Uncharacterized protein n=1 Tax=Citrullus colocynthis TaxID=252529 RepID=A0ABP0YR92_9ROSI